MTADRLYSEMVYLSADSHQFKGAYQINEISRTKLTLFCIYFAK